jgi:hypothetical protein
LARRSLKPQLNQIRTWVRQGRTDAWIAHQLEVSVGDIRGFKREHELVPGEAPEGDEGFAAGGGSEELDLRAEDDALVAAALEAEQEASGEEEADEDEGSDSDSDSDSGDDDDEDKPKRRRRGRRGGRGRTRRKQQALEGTFDHGDEGYGLWLDPAIQDDPVYAEHWAGHRPVSVTVEAERIIISRAGEESGGDDEDDD